MKQYQHKYNIFLERIHVITVYKLSWNPQKYFSDLADSSLENL